MQANVAVAFNARLEPVIQFLIGLKSDMKAHNSMRTLCYIRERLIDMLNGDETVDIATLNYSLNNVIADEGGEKIVLRQNEIMPTFFTKKEDY